jgi:hypothetical protein
MPYEDCTLLLLEMIGRIAGFLRMLPKTKVMLENDGGTSFSSTVEAPYHPIVER